MSFEKDLNVTKNDIVKIMQLKQEGKLWTKIIHKNISNNLSFL
jgi:hypothetical protein